MGLCGRKQDVMARVEGEKNRKRIKYPEIKVWVFSQHVRRLKVELCGQKYS